MPRTIAENRIPGVNKTTGTPLILGLGNLVRGDEGLGVHAANHLSSQFTAFRSVEVMDGGTLGLSLIEPIAQSSALIVIDAANLGKPPGTTEVFIGAGMDRFVVNLKTRTAHDVNLVDLLHAVKLLDCLPSARALIAIQPHTLDLSTVLSPAVEAAIKSLPDLCERLLAFLGQSNTEPDPLWITS